MKMIIALLLTASAQSTFAASLIYTNLERSNGKLYLSEVVVESGLSMEDCMLKSSTLGIHAIVAKSDNQIVKFSNDLSEVQDRQYFTSLGFHCASSK